MGLEANHVGLQENRFEFSSTFKTNMIFGLKAFKSLSCIRQFLINGPWLLKSYTPKILGYWT